MEVYKSELEARVGKEEQSCHKCNLKISGAFELVAKSVQENLDPLSTQPSGLGAFQKDLDINWYSEC